MIRSLLRVYALNLWRDPMALVLTFAVPIAFFSVFASVFGSMDAGARQRVRVAILVRGAGEASRMLESNLRNTGSLEIVALPANATPRSAEERVRLNDVSVAVVVPEGFDAAVARRTGPVPRIDLLADTANPVAVEIVRGAVQGAAYPLLGPPTGDFGDPDGAPPESVDHEPMRLEVVDVLGNPDKRPSIAYFAAGIGVMFLLFAVSGRSAILIEERERGVLLRMLTSRLSLWQLLAGRWLYLMLLGALQVTAMFAWGALVFGLDLFGCRHLVGFLLMTGATAAAAASFGLLLGVACRTRAQLNGVAVVLVLMMSALGGSMFPRFLMPESLQALGRVTFNAWALDGYRKVFWYEAHYAELAPELLVLGGTTLGLFALAALLVARWRPA